LSSSPSEAFFATSPRGLEPLLLDEIEKLGGQEAVAVPGGISFTGDWGTCYRVNFWSRIASRVLWRIASFDYRDEHTLYAHTKALDWPRYFRVEQSLRVNVTAQKSPLKSLEFATLRIKDAVCDRFREHLNRRPDIDRTNPDVRVHAFLEESRATLYLDTSGEPLFKRGWRTGALDAPLRENLAAGIIQLTDWQPHEPLLDPMCGAGTLLVEAAAMARQRPPGAKRDFAFTKLAAFEPAAWSAVKSEAQKPTTAPPLRLYGSDTDPRALAAARRNLAAAGIERWVRLEQADILSRSAPEPTGILVANPPYGERMGDAATLARFYPKLGDALKQRFPNWRAFLFTSDLRLPKLIRLHPSRRTPLFNGALECRLYEFRIVSGAHRAK
jgi:putative N6-adenine-specific DNA methylase